MTQEIITMDSSGDGGLEDDVLANVKQVHSILTQGYFPYVTKLACFLLSALTVVCFLVQLFTSDDVMLLVQYSPVMLGVVFPTIVSYATFLTSRKYIMDVCYELLPKLKSHRYLDEENFKVVKSQAKLVEYWLMISILVFILVTSVSQPVYGDEYNMVLAYKVFVDYLGNFALLIILPLWEQFFYGGFVMVGNGATLLYAAMHLKFQIFILNTQLTKMKTNFKPICKHKIGSNAKLQRKVHQELIDCIKHHQIIVELASKLNKHIQYPIMGYSLSVILTLVSVALIMFSGKNLPVNPNGNIRIIIVLICDVLLVGAYIYSGQTILSESEKVSRVIGNLPWYCYNSENRMLLIVFMHNTQTPLTLSHSGLVTIEYRLLIKLIRTVYSYFTFFSKVAKK